MIFKHKLNKGKLVAVSYTKHRGIGKTTMLVEKSIKEDIPIVVGTQRNADEIQTINKDAVIIRLAQGFTFELKGRTFPNGVLIDESLDPKMINEIMLNGIAIRGGFIREESVA